MKMSENNLEVRVIYFYSKSLEATGVLHPLSSDEEKQIHSKGSSGGQLRPNRFRWCHIKPYMLHTNWFKSDNGVSIALHNEEALNGYTDMPLGTRFLQSENTLFWSTQAKKQLLRYLYHRQQFMSGDDKNKQESKEKKEIAKSRFKLVMSYRRTNRGLLTPVLMPMFFNKSVLTLLTIIHKIESIRATSARYKNSRAIERGIRNYLESLLPEISVLQISKPSTNDIITALKLEIFERSAQYVLDDLGTVQCIHDTNKLAGVLEAFGKEVNLVHLESIERLNSAPNLKSEIRLITEEALTEI
ncbi:hypothetical protein CTT30_22800 (plasmid) [Vibrio coralliilyticus]|nr:hypothetical protein CTT30_22800 [Vibrio coralliilyticus]